MSKKSKSTSTPWTEAQPTILNAGNSLTNAYTQNAGTVQDATNQITSLLPSMIAKYQQGNAGTNAAQGYNVDVLSGKYLDQGNPYLQSIIDQTGNDVRNQWQAALGAKGLSGGSAYADIISKNLANNASNLRYTDYTNERNAMATAAGQSPALAASEYLSVTPMLATLGASSAPLDLASQYASGVGGLFGGYGTTTQKRAPFDYLMQALGNGVAAYGAGG